MAQQVPTSADLAYDAGADEQRGDTVHAVSSDLAYLRLGIVNVAFWGSPDAGDRNWILIDAGVMGSASRIRSAAQKRFGRGARPSAIVLTHGHFDHVGVLETLAEEWDTPVYAHALEHPYLNGSASYPPPDPMVGGGLMSLLSPLFPRKPVDVSARLRALPADGSIPHMAGWRWIHTPGHCPGHVSFWREADRFVIAGDAFITTAQESAYAVTLQRPELHGPPSYFTIDWVAARRSVEALARLQPRACITGHGPALQGPHFTASLAKLAADFDSVATPARGVYVHAPARADDGGAYDEP